jgi:rhamnosyltransferase subunit B
MARILLGWELGNGIGYARRLAAIADRLAAHGHEPVLALRDRTALVAPAHPVLQGPIVTGRLRPGTKGFNPAGFADLIACNGFGFADHLLHILRDWQKVIEEARPDLVMAEYAPSLVLAAWRRIPMVLIGSPYLMPPAEGARFPEREGVRQYADQDEVLAVMREAQAARGAPLPERVTQPFAEAVRVPYGLPELDPWSRHRREALHGLWEMPALAPMPAEPRLFAYLSPEAPSFATAVEALARAAIPGAAFIRGCPAELAARLAAGGVRALEEPPSLAKAIAEASFVLHHGGIDTAQTALALGRPQMLLPRYLDQRMTADALSALGIGLLPSRGGTGPQRVASELRGLAADAIMAQRAELRATLIRRRGIGDALAASVEAGRALLCAADASGVTA